MQPVAVEGRDGLMIDVLVGLACVWVGRPGRRACPCMTWWPTRGCGACSPCGPAPGPSRWDDDREGGRGRGEGW